MFMVKRRLAALLVVSLLSSQLAVAPAHAENQMGYRLLSPQKAARLPRNHGALGMDVERAQQITDGGMTFDIMLVKQVRRNSAGARAGFQIGDQIIAVDGRVFPSIATFAAYIGATPPGSQISIDYMPAGGGPQQAQRIAVAVGAAGDTAPALAPTRQAEAPASSGMSTGSKVAIGAAAAALLCYKFGCFSQGSGTGVPNDGRQQPQQPYGSQPR